MTRIWKRTNLIGPDGHPPPDDWSLLDHAGQPLARIYRATGGPQDGRWQWFVQIAPDGTPWNAGSGAAESGREAREAVEALIPPGVALRPPRRATQPS